jgi:hypothetical protein
VRVPLLLRVAVPGVECVGCCCVEGHLSLTPHRVCSVCDVADGRQRPEPEDEDSEEEDEEEPRAARAAAAAPPCTVLWGCRVHSPRPGLALALPVAQVAESLDGHPRAYQIRAEQLGSPALFIDTITQVLHNKRTEGCVVYVVALPVAVRFRAHPRVRRTRGVSVLASCQGGDRVHHTATFLHPLPPARGAHARSLVVVCVCGTIPSLSFRMGFAHAPPT